MKVLYNPAFIVWYVGPFHQWCVKAPDIVQDKFLTNVHNQYYRRQSDAWNLAKKLARHYRTPAILYRKNHNTLVVDYRSNKSEKVQTAECP